MKSFMNWLNENMYSKGDLALALAATPLFYFLSHNQPSSTQPEVTYDLKLKQDKHGIFYTVIFKNIDFGTISYPQIIRRYKQEATDIVIDTVLDTQSLEIPDGPLKIRTASLKGLSFEDINLNREEKTVTIIMKQIDPPNLRIGN